MNISSFKRQKGVFAIEFALGFFVLFMFTMLIFETCRVTYIAAVLDYATAEAARDARVQLNGTNEYDHFYENGKINCSKVPKEEKAVCQTIESFKGDQFSIWFYTFIKKNGGVLWQVLTSDSAMTVNAKHYKNLTDLASGTESKQWDKNTFSLFEVNYLYQPIFFKWSFVSSNIKRHALVIDEFERISNANK